MDKMYLIITIRKEVPDRDTADQLQQQVKDRLAQFPNLAITAQVTNHFTDD